MPTGPQGQWRPSGSWQRAIVVGRLATGQVTEQRRQEPTTNIAYLRECNRLWVATLRVLFLPLLCAVQEIRPIVHELPALLEVVRAEIRPDGCAAL